MSETKKEFPPKDFRDRSFEEDWDGTKENPLHFLICKKCDKTFAGDKSRILCKKCENENKQEKK